MTGSGVFTVFVVVLRVVLGGLFLWAGASKIPDPMAFARTVYAFNMIPSALVVPCAVVIPWMEVAAGVCLVFGLWTRSGALVCLALLGVFVVALGVNIYRGVDISCGCFGPYDAGSSLQAALVQDLFLMGSAFVLLWVDAHPFSLDRFLDGRRTPERV